MASKSGVRNWEKKPILIVQGGWWGSEAKGLVTHKLTLEKKVNIAIRTGTVNAGHTVYHNGRAYPMQQLPVSWVDPECKLVLGPGAYIHPEILQREIEWVNEAFGDGSDVRHRLYIDHNCGIHLPEHQSVAALFDRTSSIGATGKGCSVAVVDKIQSRGVNKANTFKGWLIKESPDQEDFWETLLDCMHDTVGMVNLAYDGGQQLLIEGTQGTFLDLHLGPYPYTTHKQTQAANWMAEAGLSCTLPAKLWLVMRTFPIRVAGNSGPLPNEIGWEELYEEIVKTIPIRADGKLMAGDFANFVERTTVTRKIRRIARWDWPTFDRSIMLNRPYKIALTFMNYRYPQCWGAMSYPGDAPDHFISDVEYRGEVPVGMASYGPQIENCFMR